MTWYVTGAINVTNGSDVVAGVGVDWSAFARAGDELVIPGSSTHYEILSVTSAASLRIRPAYQGGTASGMTGYAIKPTASRQLDIATRLSELISNYQGVVSGAGRGKFPTGTAGSPSLRGEASESTGINFHGNGLDFVVKGVIAAYLTDTGLIDGAGNPLLSAANAAGQLASGAILQYGENANGSYVLFAGGLIVCMRYTPNINLSEPVPKGGFIPKARREFPHLFNGQPLFVQSMLQGADITNTYAAAAQGREFDGYLAWDTDFLVLSDVPVSRYALFDIAVGVWK